jgi:DNA-binding beta-propeller fold protein YncE
MRIVRGTFAFLVGIAASMGVPADTARGGVAQPPLPVAGATYKGTIDLSVPFARFLEVPITLTASRDRRVVRFPRLRVYVDCPRGYYAWWTYALPRVRPRGGRFTAHREYSRMRDGHRWRASIDLRAAFTRDAVPGVVGRLRATIWVPRIAAGGARTCRTGPKRFDMAVTTGAPTTRGALRQLRGRAGCLTPGGRGGCTPLRGSLGGRSLVVSPDGRHVYAMGGGAVRAFSRDPATGALTQLDGASGCLAVTGEHGCARASRMHSPNKLAMSPNGTALYVSWTDWSSSSPPPRSGLSVLRRDPATGALNELAGEAGCLDAEGLEGCTRWRSIWDDGAIAAAPDGRHLYVGARGLDGSAAARVAMLYVDPTTGGVRPPDPAGCPGAQQKPEQSSQCAPRVDPFVITLAPDGRHLYTGGQAYSRDPVTGLLTPVAGRRGCYSVPDPSDPEPPADTCMSLRPFSNSVETLATSPDGRNVYIGDGAGAVGGFTRERATGRLTPIRSLGGCARFGAGAGCSNARALDGARPIAIAPDARTIYAAAYQSDSIVVLNRDRRTGALWQIAGRNGCVAGGNRRQNQTLTCAAGRALKFPWTLALSPDGRNLYVLSDDGIAVFSRRTH